MNFISLPSEILCYVFQFLLIKDALSISEVCKYFRELIVNTRLLDNASEFIVTSQTCFFLNCQKYFIKNDINHDISKPYLVNLFRNKTIYCDEKVTNVEVFKKAKEVSIEGCKKIKNVQLLENVKILNLSYSRNSYDFKPSKVEELCMISTGITEFEGFNKIKTFSGCDNGIQNLSGLENVETLILTDNEITDVSNLKNVKILNIKNNPIEDLRGLDSVEDLNISGTNVSHLRDLNHKNIKYLDISSTSIVELDVLLLMTNLKYLVINNYFHFGGLIGSLTWLEKLSLHNYLGGEQINLSGLVNLKKLHLGNTYHNVYGYEKLPNLKKLTVYDDILLYTGFLIRLKQMTQLEEVIFIERNVYAYTRKYNIAESIPEGCQWNIRPLY